ncbi:leucine-rich repeat-containing 56 isoform X1 [Brachionus plicatilis]|uniref:Leucine-rich repeat-containing 56 isoform X1 n=1 Tax=Brachionus plicatilis TaxID=10195 RepID=A0A3M7SWE9_BRAPC|nr:leucine-rich repeat-containing 56 isoform X1 [Brachionus plicatilis]
MPINIERPRSALLRGVHITEFKGNVINPDPIILQETDLLLEEYLSPTKLKALTGVNDLGSVEFLEMIVDTSETSLGNFGIYLPHLRQLKLNGSHVPRIRDLGTSLCHLKILWLSRSGLVDLDGISTLNNLQEIYLAYNEIADLSPCSLLENLRCLDLEGNLIDDIKQVEFLNLCTNLENLTLYGNPICSKPHSDFNDEESYSYRHEVVKMLPSLQILDDELTLGTKPLTPRTHDKHENINKQCPFDDDWQLINDLIDEGIGPPEEKLAINDSLRPSSSSSHGSRASTSVRPLSAMRPLSSYRIKTAMKSRPKSRMNTSSSAGLKTASRPSSSLSIRPNSDHVTDFSSDASHLTVGPALQGSLLRSLLARKKSSSTSVDKPDTNDSPQILKIDDEVEPSLSDVEVLEEDEYIYKAENLRPKSGFKKTFDDEEKIIENEIKEKPKSKREKSASRQASLERENTANRIKTSDTGYDSLSSSSCSLRLNHVIKTPEIKLNTIRHQPKIVSNLSAVSNSSLPNKSAAQSGVGSLKNLKTNLAPLPGLKLSK